jgi:hypothetical protein
MCHMACENFCQNVECEAGVSQKIRQVSVEHLLTKNKTAILIGYHCSLPLKRPVKHFENNGP